MKNLMRFSFTIALLIIVCVVNPLKAQTTDNSSDTLKAIPADVLNVLKKFCFDCHSEPGKTMAKTHLNFTKWKGYSDEKKTSKVKAMCEEVTKGKMPPKKYRENNPDAVPTAEELKILCDWIVTNK